MSVVSYTFERLETGEQSTLLTGLPERRQWHGSKGERGWLGALISRRFAAQLITYYRKHAALSPTLFAFRRNVEA